MAKFYITEAIPYVNAQPHIGHALEVIQADTIARYHRALGDETCFLWGTDENALKNVQSAEKAGTPVQAFVDQNAKLFEELGKALNVHIDIFQRTSSENHAKASQKLWELCDKAGKIYKKSYTGLYCVGCEEFKTKTELTEHGECLEHPGKKLEEISEENYFFKLSDFQRELLDLIEQGRLVIVPEFRKNEVLTFLKGGLQDFSISRSNERAKNWGIPVPGDPSQRIYVWFDALIVYISGLGFGTDESLYQKWWPADVQVVGKGITRFHAIYWIAMLLAAKQPIPKKLFVHEYITVNGQKMSKTLGNVINPHDLIQKYGADGLRYYCLAKISPFADSDFSEEKLQDTYTADLANGLGNLVARIAKLCEKSGHTFAYVEPTINKDNPVFAALENFDFNEALQYLWQFEIRLLDQDINKKEPWKLQGKELEDLLNIYVSKLRLIAKLLEPFLPETAQKIAEQFNQKKIVAGKPLFPRIS